MNVEWNGMEWNDGSFILSCNNTWENVCNPQCQLDDSRHQRVMLHAPNQLNKISSNRRNYQD